MVGSLAGAWSSPAQGCAKSHPCPGAALPGSWAPAEKGSSPAVPDPARLQPWHGHGHHAAWLKGRRPKQHPLPRAPKASHGAQKQPLGYKRLRTQHCLSLELGQELLGKRQEQGKGVRAQPGSVGAVGWGERSMQGQGHAWAQLNSHPSHVGESVALAERLVLLGVECLPFQVGLADLGRRAQAVRSPGPSPHPRAQHWCGRDTREWETQSRVPSYQHRAKMRTPLGSRATALPTLLHRAQLPGGATAPTSSRGGGTRLTAQTKQVSCQLNPSASRNRSPASILKSQPRHLVPNIFS